MRLIKEIVNQYLKTRILLGSITASLDVRFLALPFVLMSLMSCNKTDISKGPIIIEVKTLNEHGSGLHGMAGTTNRFYVTVSDDSELKELQMSLTTPEEFHSHILHDGEDIPAFKAPNIGSWEAQKLFQLSGTDTTAIFKFTAPDSIRGAWNLIVKVLDDDGNLAEQTETVVITNDSIPAIMPSATVPEVNQLGIVELNVGESFSIQGNILDANYLQKIIVSLYAQNEKIWEQIWSPENSWLFELSQIDLPEFSSVGNFKVVISATDRQGWHNWLQADLEVR